MNKFIDKSQEVIKKIVSCRMLYYIAAIILFVATYYQDFKSRVLNPAVEEVNSYSDKNVSYEPIKNGRAVSKIRLTVSTKDSLDRLKLQSQIEREFGLDQMTLWEQLEDKGLV